MVIAFFVNLNLTQLRVEMIDDHENYTQNHHNDPKYFLLICLSTTFKSVIPFALKYIHSLNVLN